MTNTQDLSGKYFIMGMLIPAVQGQAVRGRILGPIAHEFAPYYLCELYPLDSRELSVKNQIIYGMDVLARPDVYLYDDKEIWEVEWRELYRRIEQLYQAAQQARRLPRRSAGAEVAEALRELGFDGVVFDPVTEELRPAEDAPRKRRTVKPPKVDE